MRDVVQNLASHYNINEDEALRVVTQNIPVSMPSGSPLKSAKSLSDLLPNGKSLDDMNVNELGEFLVQQKSDEDVTPVLLRYILGEFKYGQRATKLLPGQKPLSKIPSAKDVAHPLGDQLEHASAVSQAFDVLAKESDYLHLHQVAGWVDMTDKSVWDDYVADVISGKVKPGMSVFEAGCGVLAFLRAVQEQTADIQIGGMDGAPATIQLIKDKLEPDNADSFYSGFMPGALAKVEDESFDVVVCNSVFQYLASDEDAKKSVEGMLRIAKKWVIIADVCNKRCEEETLAVQQGMDWCEALPEYKSYWKSWWEDNFERSGEHLVSIRHVETPFYKRRTQRYVVYIEKNAARMGPKQ